jgi:hypothetical protein
METWLSQLSADQRFRLPEMEYDLVIRLQNGPNPLLEELLVKLRLGSPVRVDRQDAGPTEARNSGPQTDAMGGGQAFRDAVDRDMARQSGKRTTHARKSHKLNDDEVRDRLVTLLNAGKTDTEASRMLVLEFGIERAVTPAAIYQARKRFLANGDLKPREAGGT